MEVGIIIGMTTRMDKEKNGAQEMRKERRERERWRTKLQR